MTSNTLRTTLIAFAVAIAVAVGAFVAFGGNESTPVASPAPAAVVTTPTPEPEPYVAPEPEPIDSIKQDAMQYTWDSMSYSDQALLCDYWQEFPQDAFAAFDEGSGGMFTQAEFDEFFSASC